ncbi:MAG: alanine dehydrogenase [Chloroflexota bacterium]
MNIGIPKEIRPGEYRVGLSPSGVEILVKAGHTIYVEHEAGLGAKFFDDEYEKVGAKIAYSAEEIFGRADLLLKVARPTEEEIDLIRPGSAIAGLLHLASTRQSKIDVLLENKITAIAYEQIQEADGSLPVLRPLSQIGGAMAAEVAARFLQSHFGGRGVLLGGIPGVPPAEVSILGGGTLGTYAARAFLGLGAHVTVLDRDVNVLQRINQFYPSIVTMVSTERNIQRVCSYSDVLVGAVLTPGERAPILVTREMVKTMKPLSVIIDTSIDEGGCVETSRPTTHDHPTYIEEGVMHYCVPNMPGVVARTATHAFVNPVIPYILEIADLGIDKAMKKNKAIEAAVNTYKGDVYHLSRLAK